MRHPPTTGDPGAGDPADPTRATAPSGDESYGLRWPGRALAVEVAALPTAARLVNDEASGYATGHATEGAANEIIEGENLEVLRVLARERGASVKLVYIDPPYNTGKEFVYSDRFRGEGASAGGHARWLSMMYPRLTLARDLLREDGVIIVSIDEHEVHNLRHLEDEIFGEENFLAELVWEKTRKNDARFFSVGHEYMLVYARSRARLRELDVRWRERKPGAEEIERCYRALRERHGEDDGAVERELRRWYAALPKSHPSRALARYKHVDARGVWRDRDISWPRPGGPVYEVLHPETGKPCAVPPNGWRFATPEAMQKQIAQGLVVFRADHTAPPIRKAYLGLDATGERAAGGQLMPSVIYRQSQVSARYMRALMGGSLFESPKDHELLARLVAYCTDRDAGDVVLDFFAGSGTTGDAVLRQNARDGGNRRFTLVQVAEPTPPRSRARRAGYATIAELCRERVRRVCRELGAAPGTARDAPGFVALHLAP